MPEAASPTDMLPEDNSLGPCFADATDSGTSRQPYKALLEWEHVEPAYAHEEGLREDRRTNSIPCDLHPSGRGQGGSSCWNFPAFQYLWLRHQVPCCWSSTRWLGWLWRLTWLRLQLLDGSLSGPLFSSLETGEACATQYSVTTHCLAGWEGASSWLSWLKQLFLLCMPTSSHHDHLLAQDFLGPFCA